MTPQQAIAQLDRQLARNGQTVTLRRGSAETPEATATVKAFVRGYKAEELVGDIDQTDSKVILSPTGLVAQGWPGGVPVKGDWITIDGEVRTVEAVGTVKLIDVVVRIELQVLGAAR